MASTTGQQVTDNQPHETAPKQMPESNMAEGLIHYGQLPFSPKATVKPFHIRMPERKLDEFKTLLRSFDIGLPSYWSSRSFSEGYGMTHDWLRRAKETWEFEWDWHERSQHFNSLPHFQADLRDRHGEETNVHFMALFSHNKQAIPICFLHGWPSSFLEYTDILTVLKQKYTPDTLPYHIVVSSLPGFVFSSGPSLERRQTFHDAADLMHRLMITLGFDKTSGYTVSGGDAGAHLARIMAATHTECKALHLTNSFVPPPPDLDMDSFTPDEQQAFTKLQNYQSHGHAFAMEQANKPATMGFVLQGNPTGILAWIGELYLSHCDPSLVLSSSSSSMKDLTTHILDTAFLYWSTSTMTRSMWPYVELFRDGPLTFLLHSLPEYHCSKPMGYSFFPHELGAMPKVLVEKTGNLVFYGRNDKGGHFAPKEVPDLFLTDVETFIHLAFSPSSPSPLEE